MECAKCGLVLTADGRCPRCGSTERMLMVNLLDRVEIRENISMTFVAPVRIWTYLPAAIQSHLKTVATSQIDREKKGLCLESVISSAAFVEGLVTDYIEMELESCLHIETRKEKVQGMLKGLEWSNWLRKKKLVQQEFGWLLEDLDGYDMIELLFKLRDQFGHGKSYQLADQRRIKGDKLQRVGPISVSGKKYGEIYQELSSRGILPPIEQHPDMNVEMFLVPDVAAAFYTHAVKFLQSFVKNIRLRNGRGMSDLLEATIK